MHTIVDMKQQVLQACTFKLIVCFAVMLCFKHQVIGYQNVPITNHNFHFTQQHYNTSIYENSLANTYVTYNTKMGIELADPTLNIKYKIINGDESRLFKPVGTLVGSFSFLRLRTRTNKVNVNREMQQHFELTVKAVGKYKQGGPSFNTRTTVYIEVLDTNDGKPLFETALYQVSVQESTSVHSEILQCTAIDADTGRNGEVYYSLERNTDQFAIHPTSGSLTLLKPLKHADRSSYQLMVLARDRGPAIISGSRITSTQVLIDVMPVNFHHPDITIREMPSIIEHGIIGINYAIIYVHDRDHGDNGRIGTVEIISGDPERYFTLTESEEHRNEYNIQVARDIDRELGPSGFNLTIEASDLGTPVKRTQKVVYVTLADRNDHAPQFLQNPYNIEVDECSPGLTPLIFIHAEDIDEGKNGQVFYQIVDGNYMGWFSLDHQSGLLSISDKQIDAEQLSHIELQVAAEDQANIGSRRRSVATVEITLADCNDNAPVFNVSQEVVHVTEKQPIFTRVTQVSAYDIDSGENGFVTFSIVNTEDVPFAIDPFTGVVTTTTILDYEAMQRLYHLKIRASDSGSPFRRENQTIVSVKLRDVNDNAPQFENVNCVGYVARDARIGTQLGVMSAIDFDAGNIISYQIMKGNTYDCFRIDSSTGALNLACDLTVLDQSVTSWSLTVTATDGRHYARPVSLNMTLVNADPGRQLSNSFGDFNCQRSSVTEELSVLLRKEEENNQLAQQQMTQPSIQFTENRNAPTFITNIERQLNVPEDIAVGHVIQSVSAYDPDPGYSGQLLYTISSGNIGGKFKVDTYTGELLVLSVLDREHSVAYYLNITVCDQGRPARCSSIMVSVNVLDVNDNPPVFDKASYHVTIPENQEANTTVIQVHATDADSSNNAVIRYRYAVSNPWFSLDSVTGLISVAGLELDREHKANHTLLVQAYNPIDEQIIGLSAITEVLVELTDVNDNAPRFLSNPLSPFGAQGNIMPAYQESSNYYPGTCKYVVRVREDLPIGSVLTTVAAYDPDFGPAGTVRYNLIDDGDGTFAMDRQTGTIRMISSLDYETIRVYNLTVRARDRAEPARITRCSVIVEVQDVDENLYAPIFSSYVYQGNVSENLPSGQRVLQLSTRDLDVDNPLATPKDYQVVYQITGGSGLGVFHIQDDGWIYTSRQLDRESTRDYWLSVSARDRALVPRVSHTDVYIRVGDVNDNVPHTIQPLYNPQVEEHSPSGTRVLQLVSRDLDEGINGRISYDITSGDPQGFFAIDTNTGLITTTDRTLDREVQHQHVLEVRVSDAGTPSLSSITRVIIHVTDINDQPPRFTEMLYTVRVLETCNTGGDGGGRAELHQGEAADMDARSGGAGGSGPRSRAVYRVLATDADTGVNSDIDYTLQAERGVRGRFKINPKTAVISAYKPLTADAQYDLTVVAVDNGRPQLNSTSRVRLEVLPCDVTPSPHPPVFVYNQQQQQQQQHTSSGHNTSAYALPYAPLSEGVRGDGAGYSKVVMENEQRGAMVLLVTATDEDGDKLWYHIEGGNTDWMFSIDPENGNIILAGTLDWETTPHYVLNISVTDGHHTAYTTAQIVIHDINDRRPTFTQDVFEAEISEDAIIGTSVLTITATDLDREAQLFYTIHSTDQLDTRSLFQITSEQTGTIVTSGRLDHESIRHHVLTVMVRDRGTPSKRSLARVEITVRDANDHVPYFLLTNPRDGYRVKVPETAAPGTRVVTVQARDLDRERNAEITYDIQAGNIGSTFTIDPQLGTVSVAQPLDITLQDSYHLVVRATDAGTPPLGNDTDVHIQVVVPDTAPPRFTHQEYTAEVLENTVSGVHVMSLTATSLSSITYAIIDGNQLGFFSLDSHSGVLSTNTVFDYEAYSFYNLTISATNIVGATTTAHVLIHVIDENDNRPLFSMDVYRGRVSESAPVDSVILDTQKAPLVIRATDADADLNALLMYNIVEAEMREVFSIDTNTGAIRTGAHVELDREAVSVYRFHVQVTDMGTPRLPALEPALVVIEIEDVNDCTPLFDEHHYSASVLLPTYEDVVVTTLQATDQDVNNTITYVIASGDDGRLFKLDSQTGVLRINGVVGLDENHQLVVEASDGVHVTQVMVDVTIAVLAVSGGSGDGLLSFTKESYHAHVAENESNNTHLLLMLQVVGNAIDEPLHFSILNPSAMFAIGQTSGIISTTGLAFDREEQENYTIVVAVRDERTPSREAHALVHVRVLDSNDNAPVFMSLPYSCVVFIDAAVGELVKQVIAVDADIAHNGEVHYTLLSDGDGRFLIDETSGEITVATPLSVTDQNREFMLLAQATDQGTDPQSSRVEIAVRVMNEATPVFPTHHQHVFISEAAPSHSVVTTIQADSPLGQKIIYSIHDGDVYGEFAVDFSTGTLKTIDKLDYETRQSYELIIRATDTNTGAYADTVLEIHVQDVNDEAPSFSALRYTATVSEASPIGTYVLTVTATDADSANNSAITYKLESSDYSVNDSSYFHIDKEKGLILIKNALDYEFKSEMVFYAVASDSGIPRISTRVIVRVLVEDLNDNAPEFTQPYYEAVLSDEARRGQFVTMVHADDRDAVSSTSLAYSIVGGAANQFRIDQSSGLVSLSSLRSPRLNRDLYVLNISVTDGVFTAFSRIHVYIAHTNDYVPTFSHMLYDVDVLENEDVGVVVTHASAVDDDRGLYGDISYYIQGDDAKENFEIDLKSGELRTLTTLDREQKSQYHIPIAAVDGGGHTGYTLIRVNVADKADSVPLFKMTNYKANVYGDANTETFVIQVSASDADLGPNGELEYNIVQDEMLIPASDYFTIHPQNGIIRVKHVLHDAINQLFQFFVRVSDKGSPPTFTDAPVEIFVMDNNAEPPQFIEHMYSFFISEGSGAQSVIATVTALSNSSIQYSIVQGFQAKHNLLDTFTIDENNGEITLMSPLDRENVDVYELTIRAETRSSPVLVAYSQVNIQIMDVNDNAPTFESQTYNVRIPENSPIGSSVVRVVAHDEDSSDNGAITYTFADEYRSLANIFDVNEQTGWITTLVVLDREEANNYMFHVQARDGGENQLSDITTVTITVDDRNDESPVFVRSVYSAAINEDALPGTVVVTVSSVDMDIGDNARIAYYITSGDPLGHFEINSAGGVYVYNMLDREATDHYELMLVASDGLHVANALLTITILDANDNAPQCEQPLYQVVIDEDADVGSFVLRVSANDADEQGTRNSRIIYQLEGRGVEMFTIHRKTGIISVRRALDREKVPEYHLQVHAVDGGGLECVMDIYIALTDVNDYAPTFTHHIYNVSIKEDAEVNTLLTRVSATDYDLGINRKIRYAMKESDGQFAIDPVSGIVMLRNTLDRETQQLYNLTLYAHDQGSPKQMTISYMLVTVLDINDNPPVFLHSTYQVEVSELTELGAHVLNVYAASIDVGINAQISYLITDGNEYGMFAMDATSGSLSVSSPLDYETSQTYLLTVRAIDHGEPPLSGTAMIHVRVMDGNDNPPTFTQEKYVGIVREDSEIGHSFVQILAHDLDSGVNGIVHYSISGGSGVELFTINQDDGVISVDGLLDREETDFYTVQVEATDTGSPALSSTVQVDIHISDANDNPPRFSQDNYTTLVQEDLSIGALVLQLQVTDADIEPNGAPFEFSLIMGNTNNTFSIDDQGVIKTAEHFARDVTESYNLIVRVHDNGTPSLFSDTYVHVSVVEESAFAPVISQLDITIYIYGDMYPGGVFGRAHATDRDVYDVILYELGDDVDSTLFSINQTTGDLQALQPLDSGMYDLLVVASDGKYRTIGAVTLNIVEISDDMKHDAVAIRFADLSPAEFVDDVMEPFSYLIQRELGAQPEDVVILSVQPYGDVVMDEELSNRARRAVDRMSSGDLDVLVAVQKAPGVYYRGNALKRRLNQLSKQMSTELGVGVLQVFNDACRKDSCNQQGLCRPDVTFLEDEPLNVIHTGKKSFVSPKHEVGFQCKCRTGYTGATCLERDDVCEPNPCQPPHVCYTDSQLSYRCDCPVGRTGPLCTQEIVTQSSASPNCIEEFCPDSQPLSFSGNSFASWRVIVPTERRMSIKFDIRTEQSSAVTLVYAEGSIDYSILEMSDGMLQYRFDCGSGEGLVRLDSTRIDDGNWHTVTVDRRGNQAEIIVDNSNHAHSSAPGTNDVLNLGNNIVSVGAEVSSAHGAVRRGFVGCMRHLMLNGVLLPFSGSCRVATFQKFQNINFNCPQTSSHTPIGACMSEPCYNGGTCIADGIDSYHCRCPELYTGPQCQTSNNHCASAPCMNGGTCQNLHNGYHCLCKQGLAGNQCERGYFCTPNPCRNRAKCIHTPTGPVCKCNGFTGALCEYDVDECRHNPCENGGICHNTYGSFYCNCTSGTSGRLCTDGPLGTMNTAAFHITIEHIVGLAGAILLLVILITLIVLCCRWRRKKARHRQLRQAKQTGKFSAVDNVDVKKFQKVSNVDAMNKNNMGASTVARSTSHAGATGSQRPAMSARPASTAYSIDSYTTLNNLDKDNVNNYGSAGDELETAGGGYWKYTKGSVPPPPPPPGLHKNTWDTNNPNITENYQSTSHLKDPKKSPLVRGPFQVHRVPLQVASTSSLSDDADDTPANNNERAARKGYQWDTSDWPADQQPLPNAVTIPLNVIPDSPASIRQIPTNKDSNSDQQLSPVYDSEPYLPIDDNDSEYVGDSDLDAGDISEDEKLMCKAEEPPTYNDVFMDGDVPNEKALLGYDSDYSLPRRKQNHDYNVPHEGRYKLTYEVSDSDADNDTGGDEDYSMSHADLMARDDIGDAYYSYNPNTLGGYTTDASVMDDRSVSMAGYESMNASQSELSGLCEIDDSEAPVSDDDDEEAVNRNLLQHATAGASLSHTHTQV